MSGNTQRISRLDGGLSNDEALKILDHHRDRNYAQAHAERSAHLVWLAGRCRNALRGMLLAVRDQIAVLPLRTGLAGRGR